MMNESLRLPDDEFARRWRCVEHLMEEQELDILLAYADDRQTFGPAHARWLADFPPHFEPVLLLFARGLKPKFLCGPETVGHAQLVSRIQEIFALEEFVHPNEDYLSIEIFSLKDIALSAAPAKKIGRIGLAGKEIMGAMLYERITGLFPGAQLLDVDYSLTLLRAQKSEGEIKLIRRAYEVAQLGISAGIEMIRPNVCERDISAEMEYVMRKAGADGLGIDNAVASGEHTRTILARPSSRKLSGNDVVILTVTPRVLGYHAAIARTVILGNVDAESLQSIQTGIHAHEESAKALRCGITGWEVEKVGRDIMAAHGYGKYFLYSGIHSVGVIEFEAPIFGPSSPEKLRDQMVVSIDIPLFGAPFFGSRTENGYLISKEGVEPLCGNQNLVYR